jgi:hypothetical protein
MGEYICKRCGLDFDQKIHLIRHLKRKNVCMAIECEKGQEELLEELNKKEGIECSECRRVYKNENSLRAHKCKRKEVNEIEELKKEIMRQAENQKLLEMKIKEIANNPKTVNNTINNTLNVTLNCIMDSSGRPIEYLLDREDLIERVIGWVKSKTGLIEYIDEKFYNPEHPENRMIKRGSTEDTIELHINGRWKQYNVIKACDYVLTNIGNDFCLFIPRIKEDEKLYAINRKALKKFENDVLKPIEWGDEISENGEKTETIIKTEEGDYVILEEVENTDKRIKITNDVAKHIQRNEKIVQ